MKSTLYSNSSFIIGKVKKDKKTKNLAKRLKPGDIALIYHRDLDEVAAESLIKKKVKAVINADTTFTGTYPNKGPQKLIEANIPIIDQVGDGIFNKLQDGSTIKLKNDKIFCGDKLLGCGKIIDEESINNMLKSTQKNMSKLIDDFVDNTLEYAKKEKWIVTKNINIPKLTTNLKNKHVLIAVRGKDYKEDLLTIKTYIEEVKPVLIGVDGGGDALLECGFSPDILIGDMDSVSDKCLQTTGEIIVHAYQDGRAPGYNRVKQLGLNAKIFPCPGTSEDAAMLLAYELGADLIVAVGTHTNIIDFLEKGRKGMASTFLVRLKIGSKLVDAKGVNKLYKTKMNYSYLVALCLAALWPIVIIISVSPAFNYLFRLISLKIKLILGF